MSNRPVFIDRTFVPIKGDKVKTNIYLSWGQTIVIRDGLDVRVTLDSCTGEYHENTPPSVITSSPLGGSGYPG